MSVRSASDLVELWKSSEIELEKNKRFQKYIERINYCTEYKPNLLEDREVLELERKNRGM